MTQWIEANAVALVAVILVYLMGLYQHAPSEEVVSERPMAVFDAVLWPFRALSLLMLMAVFIPLSYLAHRFFSMLAGKAKK